MRRSTTEAGEERVVESLVEPGRVEADRAEDLDTAGVVARFQAGERKAAFDVLYGRYFDRVYSYLRLLYREPHEAEDATQQVFLQVFEALPRYEQRAQPFRAWLFIIARNHFLKSLRVSGRVEVSEAAELNHHRDRLAWVEDQMRALTWVSDSDITLFIEHLPEPQRQVLLLRFMLDLTVAETATVLDRTPNQVRVLQHRALAFIRKRLAAIGRVVPAQPGTPTRRRPQQAPVLRYRRFSLKSP